MARKSGDRVVVMCSSCKEFKRHGTLIEVIERLDPRLLEKEFKSFLDVWAIQLDADYVHSFDGVLHRHEVIRTFNEFWLHSE